MGRHKQLKWWQLALGFLLMGTLAAGLGGLIGAVVIVVRAFLDPPLSYWVVPPIAIIVMIVYFKFVWVPIWIFRRPKDGK
jgi:phosphotransferase system  glucose/maltose/N-acetylglucosamine-specific IIC component